MSTIRRDGRRRCDSVCHNATKQHCSCICLGKYHGANVRADMHEQRQEIEDIVLNKKSAIDHARVLKETETSEVLLDFFGTLASSE